MAKNRLSLGIDVDSAVRQMDGAEDAIDDGASSAVRQLAVLAEASMKDEVPEGSGDTRDSIDTRFRRGGKTANVGARKRTQDGDLLAEIIVEGTDGSSYDPSVGLARFLGKRMEDWARTKTGDAQNAYPIAWSIIRDGHATLPNPFVDRSLDDWEDRVDDVAGTEIRQALYDLMGGR